MIVSEVDLVRWGERIGRKVSPPVVLALRGPLGAGKSVLARAVARGAGVEGNMPSPTFNLLFRYRTASGVSVVHVDLYRLEDPSELWELGWEELPGPDEIVLVEWPERAEGYLPEDRWEVKITPPAPGSPVREVRVSRIGDPTHLPGFPVTVTAGDG